jgi:hypothetical protein
MSQMVACPTQMSRGEKLITGLTMAMLAVGFAAGGFGALADGWPPPGRVHFREASAYVAAMPIRVDATQQGAGRSAGLGSRWP